MHIPEVQHFDQRWEVLETAYSLVVYRDSERQKILQDKSEWDPSDLFLTTMQNNVWVEYHLLDNPSAAKPRLVKHSAHNIDNGG